jgi:cytosine/adenosine deaminase-related metal-dependent hydrolase
MHLDKTLTGLPWMGHAAGPTRMSRIDTDKKILPHLPLSTKERAGNLIRECVARGTTHLRTHVDIDLEAGLAKLDGVLAARERLSRQGDGSDCGLPAKRCDAVPRRSRPARRGRP